LIKQKYEDAVGYYLTAFCEKHDLYFEFWINNDVGTICCLSNEWFVDFNDIRLDIDEELLDGLFFKWYDLSLESKINYRTYLKTI
jgi:hypothetical protein